MRIEKERNDESANRHATNVSTSTISNNEDGFLNEFQVDEKTMAELRVIFQLIDQISASPSIKRYA